MKKLTFCFLALLPLLFGCAPIQPSQSNIPAWDEHIPLDSDSSETPSLSKRLSNIFSEGSNYHFRKVRWGFSRERVELAEAGNTIFERKDNAIVYKVKLNAVYCQLIYTFKDNRLRTAGYMTITPIPNADNLIKEAVDKHGMPDIHERFPDRREEMTWKTHDTVIFANFYPSRTKLTQTQYDYARDRFGNPTGGLLQDVLKSKLEGRNPGKIIYLDGTYAHVDPAFFKQLHEVNSPLSELSFYEKRLMGIILRRGGTTIPGVGTIPN